MQPITRACGHREATARAKPTLVQEPRGQLTGLQGSDCAVGLLGDSVSIWWVYAVNMDLTSPKQSRISNQILPQLDQKIVCSPGRKEVCLHITLLQRDRLLEFNRAEGKPLRDVQIWSRLSLRGVTSPHWFSPTSAGAPWESLSTAGVVPLTQLQALGDLQGNTLEAVPGKQAAMHALTLAPSPAVHSFS